MIPQTEEYDVTTSGTDDSTSFDISEEDSAWIQQILRDTLYSDKIMAVLREYGTNAWDSHRMSGKGDVPIEVTLPTLGQPELVIRDRGAGLSHEDIRTVYTKYGASTKRGTDAAAGMLGIGSKSGFAYSDSFTITSWNGGKKRVYVAVLNDQRGRCDLLHTEECGDETGVEIKIAVRPQDCRDFESRAKRLFSHFVPRPRINVVLDEEFVGRDIPGLGSIDERDGYEHRGKWLAVMGPVAYAVDLGQLPGVSNAASNIGGRLDFDIGALQVSASREGLKYGDSTRTALIRRIDEIIDEYVRTMFRDIDTLSNWERRLRVRSVTQKRLPVPPSYGQRYGDGYVNLKPRPSFTVTSRNYKGRQVVTSAIDVAPKSRIVMRDEKKVMAGYALSGSDYLISPAPGFELKHATVRQELNSMLAELNIDGIGITRLSAIPWVQPVKDGKPARPRDNVRARARTFTLDQKQSFYDDNRANLWTPVDRTPRDTDVFVVLESYRVRGMEGFYESYRQDAGILKSVGLTMPAVHGYKDTAAKPVLTNALKGTEYRVWRTTGMVKLLMGVPAVAQLVNASGYSNEYNPLDHTWLRDALGASHPVTEYAAADASGRIAWTKAPSDIRVAANYVKNSMKREDLEANRHAARLSERYPLFKATGLGPLKEHHKELWLDYVKTIDLLDSVTNPKKEEEAA